MACSSFRWRRLAIGPLLSRPSPLALGVREKPDRNLEDGVLRFLRERELLLILDNFEQVMTAAPLVGEMLAASEGLRVIVTSREVMHLSTEQAYDVPPLALPDPASCPIDAMSQYEASRCSSSARRPSSPTSSSPLTTPPPSRLSAPDWTDCRWRSSWPRRD